MKVWIVCVLLCAAFTLRTATAAAIDTESGQEQKLPAAEEQQLPAEATELAVKELTYTVKDAEEALKADADAEDKSVFCPNGWAKYGARCFRLMRSTRSWIGAEAQCAAEQARLTSVHNLGEHQFLQSLLDMSGLSQAWIGAYYFQSTWLWGDASRFYYINWYSQSSPSTLSCAYIRNNGGWSTGNCASAYAYFCTIDLSTC